MITQYYTHKICNNIFIPFLPYTFNLLQIRIERFVQHKVNNLHLLEGTDNTNLSPMVSLFPAPGDPGNEVGTELLLYNVVCSREEFFIAAGPQSQIKFYF